MGTSAFTRATHLEEEGPEDHGTDDRMAAVLAQLDDNDEWIKDFEVKFGDMTWLPPKARDEPEHVKSRKAATKGRAATVHGTPRTCQPASLPDRCLAPLEVVYPDGAELLATGAEKAAPPKYTTLKVALDSGAGAHVINARDAPGYQVRPSAMSKSGAAFLAADGGRIANYGEVHVNMVSVDSNGEQHHISSRFEAADVTRALWSVSLICDSGLDVRFTAERALVLDAKGQELCVFQRCNGLYVAEVKVENPHHEDFQRPGP